MMKSKVFVSFLAGLIFVMNAFCAMGQSELTYRQFSRLPLDQQFKLYLKIEPPEPGPGIPEGTMYRNVIVTEHSGKAVFEIAKKYFERVKFAYAPGPRDRYSTVADYRFDLLSDVFAFLDVEKMLTSDEVHWLAKEYERRLEVYIREEKRFDENVVSIAFMIKETFLRLPKYLSMEPEQFRKAMYQHFIVDMKLVPVDEVAVAEDEVFSGYTGKVVPR